MKNMIWIFIACNVGGIILFFLPDAMLSSDSPAGVNWSKIKYHSVFSTNGGKT